MDENLTDKLAALKAKLSPAPVSTSEPFPLRSLLVLFFRYSETATPRDSIGHYYFELQLLLDWAGKLSKPTGRSPVPVWISNWKLKEFARLLGITEQELYYELTQIPEFVWNR